MRKQEKSGKVMTIISYVYIYIYLCVCMYVCMYAVSEIVGFSLQFAHQNVLVARQN